MLIVDRNPIYNPNLESFNVGKGRVGMRGLTDAGGPMAWWGGIDIVGPAHSNEQGWFAYEQGRTRGLIVGAGAVGVLWAAAIGWYMWKAK